MLARTKIYDKYQTVIPAEIRNKYNLSRDYYIEWDINENGKVELDFIKKLSLNEMIGRYDTKEPTNAVEDKKRFKKGEIK